MNKMYIYIILIIYFFISCSKQKNNSYGPNTQPPSQMSPSALPISMSKYKVNIATTSGIKNLCEGYALLYIIDGANKKLEGQIQCLVQGKSLIGKGQVVTLDLSKMMPAFPNTTVDTTEMSKYPQFGKIVRRPNPPVGQEGVFFYPPRPMVLNPIIQDPSKFKNFGYSEPSRVQIFLAGRQISDQGAFSIRVISTNETFTPSLYNGNLQFSNIIHWELNSSGFNNVPQKSKLIAVQNKEEYWFSSKPLVYLKIRYETALTDIAEGNFANSISLFIGSLIIDLDLIEHYELQ